MKVAHIVPPTYPRAMRLHNSAYQFALGQWLPFNEEYREYFLAANGYGHFIIVDNGAAEPKEERIPFDDVCKWAAYIGADEVVMPDVLYKAEETIAASTDAYAMRDVPENKRMVVPQGTDWEEWAWCLVELHHRLEFATIGIPKHLERLPGGRVEAINIIFREGLIKKYNIHLLGCYKDPRTEILNAHKRASFIRGIDTGAAFAYAQNQRILAVATSHYSLENEPAADEMMFKHNVGLLHSWATGQKV